MATPIFRCCALAAVAAGFVSLQAQAKILFIETFSTGTTPLASGKWDVYETGTDFKLEFDAAGTGAGDGLLRICGGSDGSGGSPAWGDVIYSKQAFTRGNNLRVSYRQWVPFGSNAQVGKHGPWHNSNTGPQYANLEAAIDYQVGDLRWGEAIPPNGIQGGNSLTNYMNRFTAGNTKNGSLLHVFQLGDSTGASFSWYQTDPNLGTRLSATPEKNTIGLATDPDNAARVTGSASTVYLGWGNADSVAGSTYLDDIVVENDEVANPGAPTLLLVGASRDWASGNTKGYQSAGGDYMIRWYLEQIGYNVVFVDDHDSLTSDANGKAAVIISSTVNSGAVNTKFRDVAVPVICWESALFDDMNMVAGAGAGLATAAAINQIEIQDEASPLVGGLTGTVTVAANADLYRYFTPSASATGAQVLATIPGQPTQAAITIFHAGLAMEGGFVAPEKRVAFFLGDFLSSETLTPQGKTLLRNVVDWATGALVPVELSGFSAE